MKTKTEKTKRWALHWDACKGCGTIEIRNEGNGDCLRCYNKIISKKYRQKPSYRISLAKSRIKTVGKYIDELKSIGLTDLAKSFIEVQKKFAQDLEQKK
jgi:hypothetical protein